MSFGAFTLTRYEANDGKIFPIRVQPETLTATIGGVANAAPTTAIGSGLPSALARGGRRVIGVKARKITASFATPPAGYKSGGLLQIPVLTEALWDAAVLGDVVVYNTATGQVVGKSQEAIR